MPEYSHHVQSFSDCSGAVACNGVYLTLLSNDNLVSYNMGDFSSEFDTYPLAHEPVCFLLYGYNISQSSLCAISKSRILLFTVDSTSVKIYTMFYVHNSHFAAFSPDDSYLAVISGCDISVWDISAKYQVMMQTVNCEFIHVQWSYTESNLLAAIGDDKSIYFFKDFNLLHYSPIVVTGTLTSLAFDPIGTFIAIGTSSGAILITDQNGSQINAVNTNSDFQNASITALYCTQPPVNESNISMNGLLLAATSTGILIVNSASFEVFHFIEFQEGIVSEDGDLCRRLQLPSNFTFIEINESFQIWCCLCTMLAKEAHLLLLQHPLLFVNLNGDFPGAYPVLDECATEFKWKDEIKECVPIIGLEYSPDGCYLAVAGGNVASIFKTPLTGNHRAWCVSVHDSVINSIAFDNCGQNLLTCSTDCSLKLWSPSQREPKLVSRFTEAVTHSSFFYLDRLIFACYASTLSLMSYRLSDKNAKALSVAEVTLPARVTCASAPNVYPSHCAVVGSAERDIIVWDWNKGCEMVRYSACHSRPVRSLAISTGSRFASVNNCDFFASSCPSDGVKLWDARVKSCVRHFNTHYNRSIVCHTAFSPCGRFLAAGSECNAGFVYSLDSGKVVSKCSGFKDAVVQVAFDPLRPDLALASNDGSLQLFSASRPKSLPKRRGGTVVIEHKRADTCM